jgi:hypothetical protein
MSPWENTVVVSAQMTLLMEIIHVLYDRLAIASDFCWAKSAYRVQLHAMQYIFFYDWSLWRAHEEGRHKLFAWLLCVPCCFAVWHLVFNWTNLNFQSPTIDEDNIQNWWSNSLERLSFRKQRSVPAVLMIIVCNLLLVAHHGLPILDHYKSFHIRSTS